ncbi:unnamed protein product [Orchesella dallaii]|uniref:Aldose 1-epimerase n=1 Tax=Orchesella dallaii TaxID=48710 RepID=A0ABP1RZ90_9HEXA
MGKITITEDIFGTYQDPITKKTLTVRRFTLANQGGVTAQVISYGATITSLNVPSKTGQVDDIVLGYDSESGYRGDGNPYFGASIGRCANRIAGGRFSIDGVEYQVSRNDGENSLHGGLVGFDKQLWEPKIEGNKVTFSLLSPDGDQGYPGNLIAQVTYELTEDDQLRFDYQAIATKSTPVVLTNHSYFNLAGHQNAGNKLESHFVQLNANEYTPVDEELITTGAIEEVEGTPFDLRTRTNLPEALKQFPEGPYGYDHNFCVNDYDGQTVRLAARVEDAESGRVLEVHSDQPGVQFYSGNLLPDPEGGDQPVVGKGGVTYWKHGAFCLEPQNYPNAVNHSNFPNAILKPGEVYRSTVIYKLITLQ